MNSGQKIVLSAQVIKQKQQSAKPKPAPPPVLIAPTQDDKQRLRKKIAQYKRIQRRQYPKKKVALPQMEVVEEPPAVEEGAEPVEQPKPEEVIEPPPQPQPVENVEQKGKLQSTLLQQYLENEFYDEQCVQADKDLQNIQSDDKKFKKKMKKVSSIMERLTKSVHELKNRYDQMDIEELLGRKRNKRRQAEAEAFVKSQAQQKQKMNKKFDSIKESQAKQKEKQQQQKKKQEERQKQKRLKQMKKELEKHKKQKQKQKKQRQQKQQKAKSFLKNYLLQDPLYKIWQQKYEKKQNKQKQIQKAYLKKRRQKYKPLDQKQLTQHMKLHYEKLRDSQQVKHQQKIQKQQQIMQQNLKLLNKIYRGKTYERIQQQLQEQQKLKLKNKQKRQRLKKYEQYVKQNFQPQVKQNSQQQQDDDDQEDEQNEDEQNQRAKQKQQKQAQYRKIKRYKFLQGKSCGEVIETVKMPLSERLQRRIGDGYLQHVKSLPKKKKVLDDRNLSQDKMTEAPSAKSRISVEIPKVPRPKHFSVNISDNPNRNQINNLLLMLKGKDNMVQMKQRFLCKLSDKSHFDNVQAEINSNIVQNIQRKLSLLTKL